MKIALVHDQLYEFGGAERVLTALKRIFPEAPIFTSFCDRKRLHKTVPDSVGWEIYESWVSRIPFFYKIYSPLRFLAPFVWESFDFSSYNFVISSSGWYMSKGIITKPPTVHICYLHHQPRYLYYYETAINWQRYLPIKIYSHIINHFLRMWDFTSSQRPDIIIANSKETQKRIAKFYRRKSIVIYPPVYIAPYKFKNKSRHGESYYITVSRLQKAKHIDFLIEAANKYKFNLKIIGDGSDKKYLQRIAGPTVSILGRISDDELIKEYINAKAFLFASRDEEFGIAPVEAMGLGVPVIAYASGGLIETVKEGFNGYLYYDFSIKKLYEKIQKIERLTDKDYFYMCKTARKEAEKYNEIVFRKKILNLIYTVKQKKQL